MYSSYSSEPRNKIPKKEKNARDSNDVVINLVYLESLAMSGLNTNEPRTILIG